MPEFTHSDGVAYEVVPTDMWDFADAMFAKRASGGMSVLEIEQGVMKLDPDAVIGFMAVSIHKQRPVATPEKLREEIEGGGSSVVSFFEDLAREQVGEVEAVVVPPDEGADAPPL